MPLGGGSEITGLVERPTTLSLADLRRLPVRQVESFHQCAGAPRRPDVAARRSANVVWRGVDLADLLRRCGIRNEARFLWAYGLDHGGYDGVSARWYVKDMPLTRLGEGGVLLAYAVNGEPLKPEHGFPLRLVVPGYYGTNAVKWLWRLELAEARAGGPFTTELYNDPDPSTGGTRPV
jgi:sulfane dehydrogenase subunit SoxC